MHKTPQNNSKNKPTFNKADSSSTKSTNSFFNSDTSKGAKTPFFTNKPQTPFFTKVAPAQLKSTVSQQNNQPASDPKTENNTGMPDELKSGMESLSGLDMSDVKVHYNSDNPSQLNAHAYAQGTDIHLGQGQEKHLAHEAWHVVQQKQGRVKPTIQMKAGVEINDDKGLEKEADEMGELAEKSSYYTSFQIEPSQSGSFSSNVVQRTKPWSEGLTEQEKADNATKIQRMRQVLMQLSLGNFWYARNTAQQMALAANDPVIKYARVRGLSNLVEFLSQAKRLSENNEADVETQAQRASVLAGNIYAATMGLSKRGTYARELFERILQYLVINTIDNNKAETDKETNRTKITALRKIITNFGHGGLSYISGRQLNSHIQRFGELRAANFRPEAITSGELTELKNFYDQSKTIAENSADEYDKARQAKNKAAEIFDATDGWNKWSETATVLFEGIARFLIKDSLSEDYVLEEKPKDLKIFAIEKHKGDRARLEEYVRAGYTAEIKQNDPKLYNSCEWILKKRTKLYALTPTGDSDLRVSDQGKSPADYHALFPTGDLGGELFGGEIVDYDIRAQVYNAGKIVIHHKGVGGWRSENKIMVVEPSKKTKEKVWQTLKHEVQHDADKHSMEPLARYKSEYRAYSGQGGPPFNDLSNETPITKSKGGSSEYQWTEKQWAIFEHMYDAADSYEYLNENWDADTEGFRQAVVAYKDPDTEGINRDNSIRVDDFYNYLIKIPEDTSELTKEVDDLIKASFGDGENTNKLERSDAQYILNESPELLAKIGTHLKGQALEAILERLRSVT